MFKSNLKWVLLIYILPLLIWSQEFKLLTPPILDLGEVPADTIASGKILFSNIGDKSLTIDRVQTSCGCTVVSLDKLTYLPGEEGELPVQFNTKGYSGLTRKTVTFFLKEGNPSSVRIVLQAKVTPQVEIIPQFINFQQVKFSDQVTKLSFEIKNNTDKVIEAAIGKNQKKSINVQPNVFSINPNSTQQVWVSFKPTKSGRDDSAVLVEIRQPFTMLKRIPVFVNVLE
jgi:hypothetical protein